jgi:hypothetical protein
MLATCPAHLIRLDLNNHNYITCITDALPFHTQYYGFVLINLYIPGQQMGRQKTLYVMVAMN